MKMLKRQVCAIFQSQILNESEVIQILKVVRWHFCQVYSNIIFRMINVTVFAIILYDPQKYTL